MSIETEDDFAALQRVGYVVARALADMEQAVEPGVTTADVDAVGGSCIRAAGARSAPQVFYGCPAMTLISVNDEIVHGLPGRRRLRSGDVVKLDVTAELDGYVADAARTVVVPPGRPAGDGLRDAARTAFDRASAVARAGMPVSFIGREVERSVTRSGYSVIRELSGHGVGRAIHEPPNVPNFFDPRQRAVLTEGLVLTIEPIIAARACGAVMERDGWTLRTDNGALAAHFEETIVITRGAPLVVTRLGHT
jgi:methionyl aminopeptidase